MIVCKFCGNENPDEYQYCEICGKELKNALLNSLVSFNADGTVNTGDNNTALGGVPKKGFEDTGGGAASGPRRFDDGSDKEGGSQIGTVIATILAILVLVGVAGYFLIFSNNAPLAHLKELLPF